MDSDDIAKQGGDMGPAQQQNYTHAVNAKAKELHITYKLADDLLTLERRIRDLENKG